MRYLFLTASGLSRIWPVFAPVTEEACHTPFPCASSCMSCTVISCTGRRLPRSANPLESPRTLYDRKRMFVRQKAIWLGALPDLEEAAISFPESIMKSRNLRKKPNRRQPEKRAHPQTAGRGGAPKINSPKEKQAYPTENRVLKGAKFCGVCLFCSRGLKNRN